MPSAVPRSRGETKPALSLYGIGGEYCYDRFDEIVLLWERFQRSVPAGSATYGVTLAIENDAERFQYYACTDHLISGLDLAEITIPAQRQQVFEHRGPARELMRTFNYIWGVWIPENKAKLSGIDFEYYGPDYDPESEGAIAEIYIPIV